MKAICLIKLGEFADASNVIIIALGLHPKEKAELNYLLSTCYKETKEQRKQEYYLTKAIEIEPKNALYLKDLALLNIAQHSFSQGRDLLIKALALNPSDGELHYQLAQIFIKQSAPDKAIEELSKAIDHGYANADSLGQRGWFYFEKHRYGDAKADLEEALSKNPQDEDVKSTLARTDKAIGIAAKAKVGTRQLPDTIASEDEPVSANELRGDYVGKAYDSLKQGKAGYATRVLKTAVRMNPNDVRARRYLASALYSNGDYAAASSQFAFAAAQQPLTLEEQFFYGKALLKATKFEQAISVLQSLVNQQPNYSQARMSLIKAYSLAGFRDHAREQCQIGMQQARNQSEYTDFKSLLP